LLRRSPAEFFQRRARVEEITPFTEKLRAYLATDPYAVDYLRMLAINYTFAGNREAAGIALLKLKMLGITYRIETGD